MTRNLKTDNELTEREIKAARMLAEGEKTLDQIAKEIGVGRATLYEWRQREDFHALVSDLTQATVDRAREVLQAHAQEAAEKLVKMMKGKKSTASLRAAEQILNRTGLAAPAESVIVQQQAQAVLPDDYGAYLAWKAKQEGGAEQ